MGYLMEEECVSFLITIHNEIKTRQISVDQLSYKLLMEVINTSELSEEITNYYINKGKVYTTENINRQLEFYSDIHSYCNTTNKVYLSKIDVLKYFIKSTKFRDEFGLNKYAVLLTQSINTDFEWYVHSPSFFLNSIFIEINNAIIDGNNVVITTSTNPVFVKDTLRNLLTDNLHDVNITIIYSTSGKEIIKDKVQVDCGFTSTNVLLLDVPCTVQSVIKEQSKGYDSVVSLFNTKDVETQDVIVDFAKSLNNLKVDRNNYILNVDFSKEDGRIHIVYSYYKVDTDTRKLEFIDSFDIDDFIRVVI